MDMRLAFAVAFDMTFCTSFAWSVDRRCRGPRVSSSSPGHERSVSRGTHPSHIFHSLNRRHKNLLCDLLSSICRLSGCGLEKPSRASARVVQSLSCRLSYSEGRGSKQVKVVAGRIISDAFHSDLHAMKNIDGALGASYTIRSEGSVGLFTSLMLRGAYALAVEFESSPGLTVDVRPTAEILEASEKWTKCSIAIMEHRPPQ